MQLKGGRLPDPAAVARHLRNCNLGATLRGVEATVAGSLAEESGELVLRASGTGERLRLTRLRHKVQWDVAGKREEPATQAEREAFERLRREAAGHSGPLQVTGPLREGDPGGSLLLEVRDFDWRAEESPAPPMPPSG